MPSCVCPYFTEDVREIKVRCDGMSLPDRSSSNIVFLTVDPVPFEVSPKLVHELFTGSVYRQLNKRAELATFNAYEVDLTLDTFRKSAPHRSEECRLKIILTVGQETYEALYPGHIPILEDRLNTVGGPLVAILLHQDLKQTIERCWMGEGHVDFKIQIDLFYIDPLQILES